MENNEDNSNWRDVLKYEFEAGEESFMFQIRCEARWNKEAHLRLFKAMVECCKSHEGKTHVERWIAAGFDWMDSYPAQCIDCSLDENYYINAAINFNYLTWWLFRGEGLADDEFEPI